MELKIPPVIVFFICLALIFGCYYLLPDYTYTFPYRKTLSRIFLVIGALSGVLGILAFRLKSTTVDPTNPDKASSLVTGGIYQFTRNPMYFGMAMVLIGGAMRIGNPAGFISVILFICYMTKFQIKPEEKALLKNFGEAYQQYMDRVRRWI